MVHVKCVRVTWLWERSELCFQRGFETRASRHTSDCSLQLIESLVISFCLRRAGRERCVQRNATLNNSITKRTGRTNRGLHFCECHTGLLRVLEGVGILKCERFRSLSRRAALRHLTSIGWSSLNRHRLLIRIPYQITVSANLVDRFGTARYLVRWSEVGRIILWREIDRSVGSGSVMAPSRAAGLIQNSSLTARNHHIVLTDAGDSRRRS